MISDSRRQADDPRARKKDEEEEEIPEWNRYYSSVDREPRDGDKENPYFKVGYIIYYIIYEYIALNDFLYNHCHLTKV